jgi:hypothetical protein
MINGGDKNTNNYKINGQWYGKVGNTDKYKTAGAMNGEK